MAKELPFFKFEISEWMFGRIQKQPESIQGMFINLCCKYWHKLGEYKHEDAGLDFGADRIQILIDNRLIGNDDGYIFIKFLDLQLDECEQTSKKNSIKGLKSAEIRRLRKQQSTTVKPQLTAVQPNSTEEKRIEEKRGDYRTPEVFETKQQAHKEITDNYHDIEKARSILSNRGWVSATDNDVGALLFHFLETNDDATEKPKSEVRQHFKNWINKFDLNELTKLSISISTRFRQRQQA